MLCLIMTIINGSANNIIRCIIYLIRSVYMSFVRQLVVTHEFFEPDENKVGDVSSFLGTEYSNN